MSEDDDKMEMVSQVMIRSTEHFEVWEEEWDMGNAEHFENVKDIAVRNKQGDYAGPKEVVNLFEKFGIAPELIEDDSDVCTIGWSEREEKYYGWSHRAAFGFGLDDMIYEEGFDDDAPFRKHGNTRIKSKDDARKAAINFARDVA